MTIRLLAQHEKYPANTIVTLGAATEAGLIAAKQASADTTGGVAWVEPTLPNQVYKAEAVIDPAGNVLRVEAGNGNLVQFPGSLALPKWRAAVAKVRAGTATAKLAICGSSTAAGHGAGTRNLGLTARITQMLNSYYVPTTSGNITGGSFGSVATLTGYDSRITFGAGWEASTTDAPLGSFSFRNPAGTGSTTGLLQFTPDDAFNIIDLYVKKTPGSGTLSISIDGGVTPLTTSGSGAEELAFVRVQGLAVGKNTVTLRATSLGTEGVEVYMIRTYNTTSRTVDVLQWAHTGGTAQNFLNATKPWSAYNLMNRVAPDLAMFIVASNVWTGGQSMNTFRGQMQSWVDRLKETSDVMLVAGIPTPANEVSLATQQKYVEATQEIAANNGILFIDNWRRFIAQLDQPNNQNGMKFDSGHLNGPGYADFAMPIYKAITEV